MCQKRKTDKPYIIYQPNNYYIAWRQKQGLTKIKFYTRTVSKKTLSLSSDTKPDNDKIQDRLQVKTNTLKRNKWVLGNRQFDMQTTFAIRTK